MIICNLQETPYDKKSEFRMQGYCDDIFALVMLDLGIDIPMVCPDGSPVPEYKDEIDEKYTKKLEEVEKKVKDLKKEN